MNLNKKWQLSLAGLLEIMLVYLAVCFTTISYKSNVFSGLAIIIFLLVSVIYIISSSAIYGFLEIRKWAIQLHHINIIATFLITTLLLRDIQGKHFLRYQRMLLFLFLIMFILCEIIYVKKNGFKEWKKAMLYIAANCKFNKGLLCILVGFTILSIHTEGIPYVWDSRLYYISCQNLDAFSISDLAIYGHVAQTFGLLMKLGTVIFGSVEIAAYILNVLLALASIIAFYGILKYVCPYSNKLELDLATGVYAFSPYLLGLVNYLNLDFYCACLFPPLVYFAIKEKWIYHIIIAIMFVFTKEPAIVIYAGFCVGYFLCKENKRHEKHKEIRILDICKTIQYWYMFLIALLWVGTYKLLGPWSAGVGGVKFDIVYIQEKLKVMFVLNFSWIISSICIISLIAFWRSKHKEYDSLFWSLVISLIFFVLFSCTFKTISHYRYNDVLFFVLWLLAAPLCLSIKKKWAKNFILICMIGVMLLASYATVDPISNLFFDTVYTGNGRMWTVSDQKHFGDAIIYNKQSLNLEVTINEAISDAVEDEDTIILQSKYNNPWMLDGLSDYGTLSDSNKRSDFYWNKERQQREIFEKQDNYLIIMNHVSTMEDLNKVVAGDEKGKIFSYITIYQDEESLVEEISNSYRVLDCEVYQYQNWKIERVRFEK